MDKIDNGGSAFPIDSYMLNPNATEKEIKEAQGMTLRDYFAAAALQGEVGGEDFGGEISLFRSAENAQLMARRAYRLADAMLAARREAQP